MTSLQFFGLLALFSTIFCSWGTLEQVLHTARIKCVDGLSLCDCESRLWGKLPWFLYAFSLPVVDLPVLLTNIIGASLALTLLYQYFVYAERSRITQCRVWLQYFLFGLTLALLIAGRAFLTQFQFVFASLPVYATLFALGVGSAMQLHSVASRRSSHALARRRYVAYLAGGTLWLVYGISRYHQLGWTESWTVIVTASLGIAMNAAILQQLTRSAARQPSEERIANLDVPQLSALSKAA